MIVVSDTTPLISLMKIGKLDLVANLFGEIQVPEAVYYELVSNTKFPAESKMIRESPCIKKVSVADIKAVELLRRSTGLAMGESEAIILSDQNSSDVLLMDEAKGRQVAKLMGINLMGTIGMLLVAYKEMYLSREEILKCIDILKNSGRHISNQLYEDLLRKIND